MKLKMDLSKALYNEETVRMIEDSHNIDASTGEEALAAAEIVAALKGNPDTELPEELVD
jgi:hypothetical protein